MKILIGYKPSFIRTYAKFERDLQEEILRVIALLQENPKNPVLRTHKLKGKFEGRFSFSVNYKYRIVFIYANKHEIILLDVGDHDVYR